MANAYKVYRIGRLLLAETGALEFHGEDEKRAFILASLKYEGTVAPPHTRFEWGFFEFESVDVEGKKLLTGQLVKFSSSAQSAEVVDKEEHRVQLLTLENRVVAKSPFFLDFRSGLIAFLPVEGISVLQFADYFCQLIRRANNTVFFSPKITMVTDEIEFLASIRSFKSVSSVTVTLHPSNPDHRDKWAAIDEEMRLMRATQKRIRYSSDKPDGMKTPDEGDSAYSHILMAEDGYGEAEIIGTAEGGEKKVIKTKKQPMSAQVLATVDKVTAAKAIFERLAQVLERIRG